VRDATETSDAAALLSVPRTEHPWRRDAEIHRPVLVRLALRGQDHPTVLHLDQRAGTMEGAADGASDRRKTGTFSRRDSVPIVSQF
jgi:hypothetical protein